MLSWGEGGGLLYFTCILIVCMYMPETGDAAIGGPASIPPSWYHRGCFFSVYGETRAWLPARRGSRLAGELRRRCVGSGYGAGFLGLGEGTARGRCSARALAIEDVTEEDDHDGSGGAPCGPWQMVTPRAADRDEEIVAQSVLSANNDT